MKFLIIFKIISIISLYVVSVSANEITIETKEKYLTKKESQKYLRNKNETTKLEESKNLYLLVIIVFFLIILSLLRPKSKPKKKKRLKIYLGTDIHSHLLPRLDDGSKSMDESLSLIRGLKDLGYTKIITTPHIMSHRFPNSSTIILNSFHRLKKALKKKKIDIEIEVASEYYLDDHFVNLLKKKDILTFGDKYVLFELPRREMPENLFEVITLIKEQGYKPVLAHPERYQYFHNDFKMYEEIKNAGVFFQINLISMEGFYTVAVKNVVLQIIDSGFVDFLGSDTHKRMYLDSLKEVLKSHSFQNIFEKNVILNRSL